jgi:hypothetical protein
MPLDKKNGIRENTKTLMSSVDTPARHKAILTIMKKHNMSYDEALFHQSMRISQSINRK